MSAAKRQECGERSPVCKFDEGPVLCTREAGHGGAHTAPEPIEHTIPGYLPNTRRWKDGHIV